MDIKSVVIKWVKPAKKFSARLPQPVQYFLPRLLASFLIVIAVLALAVWLPERSANGQMRRYIEQTAKQETLLIAAGERLQIIPLPDQMDPPSPKARQQAEATLSQLRKLDSPPPEPPRPLPERDERLKQFNKITGSPTYGQALTGSRKALDQTRSLMAYHAEVLRVVSKLMEYRAAVDMAPEDNVILAKRLEATGEGLRSLSERLDGLRGYEDDGLAEIKRSVQYIEEQRQSLFAALKAGQLADKQPFIASVAAAQQTIMDNRQDFWLAQRQKQADALTEARIVLARPLEQLKTLR